MTDKPDGKRWGWLRRAVWTVVALFALYPVSAGPANWLCDRGYIDFDTLCDIYEPLDTACGQSETVSGVYDWYLRLFIRQHQQPVGGGQF
jgi:hypothetical protein